MSKRTGTLFKNEFQTQQNCIGPNRNNWVESPLPVATRLKCQRRKRRNIYMHAQTHTKNYIHSDTKQCLQ